MRSCTLYTLGRAELREGESSFGALVSMQPKRLALLAYLSLHAAESAPSREKLLAYFWPEAATEEGRAALRQALHHLRARLGEDAITSTTDGRVALQSAHLACDAVQLQLAAASGDDARVIELYRGEFLEGLLPRESSPEFEEWIDRQRRRIRLLAAVSAERHARALASAGQLDQAISVASRRTEIAPDDEDALRTLLKLLEQAGRAGEAIAVAERATRDFESRLGVPTSAETRALVAGIRTRRRAESAPSLAAVEKISAAADVDSRAGSPTSSRPISGTAAQSDGLAHDSSRVNAHGGAQHNAQFDAQRVGTTAAPETRSQHRSKLRIIVASLVVIGAIAALATQQWRSTNRDRAALAGASVSNTDAPAPDRIVVADFRDNGDGTGAAVAAALRVDLAQSPSVRVLTGAQVRDAARRAQSNGALSLEDSVVRSIAVREGLKAFVTGEVNKAGGNWLLTAQLIDARNGNSLISVRETAEDSAGFVPAMERLSRALTAKATTALSAQPAAIPLERATTPSILALRAYSEGVQLLDDGNREKGVARLQDAVRADSGFATAWRLLGSTWSVLGEPAKSENAMRHAFANRERLTFRERYLLEGSYYRNLTGNYDAAVASYRTLLGAYPNDVAGMNNLALVYVSLQAHAQAESLFTRVIAADTTLVHARLTLAEQLAMQNRHADAQKVMDETIRRFPDHPTVRLTPIYLAVSAQDWARADSLAIVRVNSGVQDIQQVDALQTLAQIEIVRGKIDRARGHLASAMEYALKSQSPYRFLSAAITQSWLELRYRDDVSAARRSLQRALARTPLDRIPESDRPLGALTQLMLAMGMKREALQYAGGADAPSVSKMEQPYTHGLLLMSDSRSAEAAQVFARAAAQKEGCSMCVLPQLAVARAASGDTVGAISAAEEYVSSPYIHRFEADAVELPSLLMHLADWYAARGEVANAGRTRARLLQLWKDADPTLGTRIADLRRRASQAPPG